MNAEATALDVATITLNPAIDRTVTITNFTAGDVNRVEAAQDTPGGKGVNVASVLADCRLRAGATGFLGRDNAGSFEALFAQKKIADRFVRIAGSTRVSIKIADPIRKQTTDINFPGPAPEPKDIEALRIILASMQSDWWVAAGSIPPGLDPSICREIIVGLKKRGAKVAFDASGAALREGIEAGPHIVKPNLIELEDLLGGKLGGTDAIIQAARRLLAKGIELVAVSMGRDGAVFVTAKETVIAHPPAIEVRSTVGAGDAMVAGIVAAQIRRLPLEECARLATAFSLETLTRIEPGISSQDAIEASMKRVAIQLIDL